MTPRIAALALVVLANIALPAHAQSPADAKPTLSANGQGQVMAVPDIALVTIGVTTRAATAAEALDQNSAALTMVVDTVMVEGVDEKDIGTAGINISPVYQSPLRDVEQNEPPKIIGYTVSNTVNVTIRDVTASGGILDKVVKAGANRLQGISFDIADRKSHEDAALRAAVADARHQAELMAEAAGVKLGRILSITGSTSGGPQPAFARADFATAAVPVLPGQQSVTANAHVIWEIAE